MKKEFTQLDHVNFTVSNFQESVLWYEKIFNFKLVEEGKSLEGRQWGILKSGESMLAITEDPERSSKEDRSLHKIYHFGLRVHNENLWRQRLKEFRLETFYDSPVQYPHSQSWYVQDPTGNEIEVSLWEENKAQF